MFIVIEGGDGVGKSTTVDLLSKRLSAESYHTPPKAYMSKRDEIDKNASPVEHYEFYREGVFEASKEIRSLVKNGKNVVCDRYFLSTYTYHRVMGVDAKKEDFDGILRPDLTVILSVDHSIQIDRIIERGMSEGDKRMLEKQIEITAAFYRDVLELELPFLIIDTGLFRPEQVVDIIESTVKLLKN